MSHISPIQTEIRQKKTSVNYPRPIKGMTLKTICLIQDNLFMNIILFFLSFKLNGSLNIYPRSTHLLTHSSVRIIL